MAFVSLKNRLQAFGLGGENSQREGGLLQVLGTGVVCLFMLIWTFQTSGLPEDGDYMGKFFADMNQSVVCWWHLFVGVLLFWLERKSPWRFFWLLGGLERGLWMLGLFVLMRWNRIDSLERRPAVKVWGWRLFEGLVICGLLFYFAQYIWYYAGGVPGSEVYVEFSYYSVGRFFYVGLLWAVAAGMGFRNYHEVLRFVWVAGSFVNGVFWYYIYTFVESIRRYRNIKRGIG